MLLYIVCAVPASMSMLKIKLFISFLLLYYYSKSIKYRYVQKLVQNTLRKIPME